MPERKEALAWRENGENPNARLAREGKNFGTREK
jgi:hypothetical protein